MARLLLRPSPVCIVTALVDGAAPPQTVPVCIVTALKNRQHAIV
jgi:hypothetical protein